MTRRRTEDARVTLAVAAVVLLGGPTFIYLLAIVAGLDPATL